MVLKAIGLVIAGVFIVSAVLDRNRRIISGSISFEKEEMKQQGCLGISFRVWSSWGL